ILAAEFLDHAEHAAQGLALGQRPLRRHLDDHAIGHWVGKGQAQFDHIGAGLRQGVENGLAGGKVGIAAHDIGDERGTVFGLAPGKAGIDTGGHYFSSPRYLPTLSTSLSPRPDRHSTMDWSLPILGASFITCARPWALSSAGMMP